MPIPFVDRGGGDEAFNAVLKSETRGTGMTLTGHGGWLTATRPFPDLAMAVDPSGMDSLPRYGSQIDRTTSIDHLRDLHNRQEPITASSLDAGTVASSEGLATLGRAMILGGDLYENAVLRSIPHARPGLRMVAFCPSRIREAAEDLVSAVTWLKRKLCLRVLQRFVIAHELGHFFLDPALRLRGDSRFHDAFASHIGYGRFRDQDSRDIVQAFSVLRQPRDYNYYLLLNNLDQTKDVLTKALAGHLEEARIDFNSLVAAQPLIGTRDAKLRVLGDINGWPGYAAWNPVVVCSGTVVGVANLRDGAVVASKIRILEGFFPESVRIYANAIETLTPTAARCGVARLIPEARLDIHALVGSGATFETILEACETGRPPPPGGPPPAVTRYNVCIPCRCGRYVVTEEITQLPDAVDLDGERVAVCDRCGSEVRHRGGGIVFLAMSPTGNLDWYSRGGTSEMEERMRATEKWLREAQPSDAIRRLLRSQDDPTHE